MLQPPEVSMSVARACVLIALCLLACRSKTAAEKPSVSALEPAPSAERAPVGQTNAPSAEVSPAALGSLAPDFTLPDLEGKAVSLSAFRGKTVVLEWFNPDCPFVRASHSKGSLKDAAERHQKAGVVWLAINSAAPGKQGSGRETNVQGRDRFGIEHPILLDESGRIGKLYGAERTPQAYVIDPKGILVYRGAFDNSPDGEGESPTSGTLVRHVDVALAELAQGKPISLRETPAYGCSVKYGS
jgi:peroxiredoxin